MSFLVKWNKIYSGFVLINPNKVLKIVILDIKTRLILINFVLHFDKIILFKIVFLLKKFYRYYKNYTITYETFKNRGQETYY